MEKELRVKKIKTGTVIDHLPAGSALNVLKALGINGDYGTPVSVLISVPSKDAGMKDVVKIEDKMLEPEEVNKIALIARGATINIIKDYEVVKKTKVEVPDEVAGIITCANPNCITNQREPIKAKFIVEGKEPILLRCKYCERIMDKMLIEEQL